MDYKVLQLLQSGGGGGGGGGDVLTLTSCVLRSDRAESVWMPTDLISTISGSFNPVAEKEAPAPGSYFIYILKSFFRGDPGLCVCGGGGGG